MIPQYRVTWNEIMPLPGGDIPVPFHGCVHDNLEDAERERANRYVACTQHYRGNEVINVTPHYYNVRIEARVKSEESWD